MRTAVYYPKYQVSYLSITVFPWDGLVICGRNIHCYHIGGNGCFNTNVQHWVVSNWFGWLEAVLPKRITCSSWYIMRLCLLEITLSFTRPTLLKKIFPLLVTGPTVTLLGLSLIKTGFESWAGGSGSSGCIDRPINGPFVVCPSVGAPHALPWGSAEHVGLGFLVFVTVIICECFGSPIMQSCFIVLGLPVGCIIAVATSYFSSVGINAAPVASFIRMKTFSLSAYGPTVLPLLAVYIILMMEARGDITATCDVFRLEVKGRLFDSRIQAGILADGFNGLLAGLCTITPIPTFVKKNGFIAFLYSVYLLVVQTAKPVMLPVSSLSL